MTFRTRLQIAFVALAMVSVGGLAVVMRIEMTHRLTAEYQRRVTSQVGVIRNDLASESEGIARRLADVATALADDNRFRLAVGGEGDRAYVLDYAAHAMHLAGLSMLQIQDPDGRILSSGHFRNEFDRLEPGLPRLIAEAPGGPALVEARAPEAPFLALVRADSARVGRAWLWLVGGRAVGPEFLRRLAQDQELVVTLQSPAGTVSSADSADVGPNVVAVEMALPFVTTSAGGAHVVQAQLLVTQPVTPLAQLRRSVDTWSLIAGLIAIAAALLLGSWASARLSRPLAELAHQTAKLDLERLDVDFASGRPDEVGALARVLAAMTERLRRGTQQLREAERRAAVGDVARQVNHDIKNGLAPIRNVLRHLGAVADQEPDHLVSIFRDRKATLDASVQYLETLAATYARLSPKLDGGSADVRTAVEDVARGVASGAVTLKTQIAADLPLVNGDAVALRRILENVVSNAIDAASLGTRPTDAVVQITAERAEINSEGAERSLGVRITVTDTGRGMTKEQLERAFQDFYTTKPGGTGLGLSVVRRLVADLGGSLKVQTEPGAGTRVEVVLPAARSPERPTAS